MWYNIEVDKAKLKGSIMSKILEGKYYSDKDVETMQKKYVELTSSPFGCLVGTEMLQALVDELKKYEKEHKVLIEIRKIEREVKPSSFADTLKLMMIDNCEEGYKNNID